MSFNFPEKQGLYDPQFEHDSCGVGFVAHLKNHEVILSSPRFVFHMGISESNLDRLIELISSFKLR